MPEYAVRWICTVNGESREIKGDYMSCAVAYNAIQFAAEVRDCKFVGPLHVTDAGLDTDALRVV